MAPIRLNVGKAEAALGKLNVGKAKAALAKLNVGKNRNHFTDLVDTLYTNRNIDHFKGLLP
jgi:hypothetical protein